MTATRSAPTSPPRATDAPPLPPTSLQLRLDPPRLHGRDPELSLLGDLLRRPAADGGAIVLIEGEPGIGKSRLLAEALAMARRTGVRTAAAAAHEPDSAMPLAPLLAALFGGEDPLLAPPLLRDLSGTPDQRFWMLQELHGLLERTASERPLLIALDDVQWADPGTLSALRTLPRRLAAHPVTWLLTYRGPARSAALTEALAALGDEGAQTIRLAPLDDVAVGALTADMLDAEPEPELLALAARAGGNPFLLVELLRGLAEDGVLRVGGGRAALFAPQRLPDRVGHSMRARLERLSDPAREAVELAAVLGSRFSVDDLAQLLDQSAAALLGPLLEALDADLLIEAGGELAFGHDLIREAIHDALPRPVRDALHRQAANVLLTSGASPVKAAAHLNAGAQVGDRVAIDTLRAAACELAPTAPSSAADFALRALELTPADDAALGGLCADTIPLLLRAGRMDEVDAVAGRALDAPLGAEDEGRVRLALAQLRMHDAAGEAVVECRRALELDGLSAATRADLLALLAHGLTEAVAPIGSSCGAVAGAEGPFEVDAAQAQLAASAALDAARASGRSAAEVSALVDLATAAHRRGELHVAQELVEEAVRVADAGPPDARAFAIPEQLRSTVLGALDRLDEALATATDGLQEAQRHGAPAALARWTVTRCALRLDAGLLADARTDAEALLVLDGAGPAAVATARDVLDRVAGHTGERRLATGDGAGMSPASDAPVPGDGREPAGELAPPLGAPGLVRRALAVGDRERAVAAVQTSAHRAELASGVPSLSAAAAHARALLDGDDLDGLSHAVSHARESARPLTLASALEDLGRAAAARGARKDAVAAFDEALVAWAGAGAERDAARVRQRLREMGVRRRLVASARSASARGWAALTDAEVLVARVVAGGATNREAAERLFLSPHTVSSHLRHAFAKLDINSRVELVRIVMEHDDGAEVASSATA